MNCPVCEKDLELSEMGVECCSCAPLDYVRKAIALRAELEAARTKLEAEYSRVQGYREHVDKLTAERDAAVERVEALTVKCDLLAASLKKADAEVEAAKGVIANLYEMGDEAVQQCNAALDRAEQAEETVAQLAGYCLAHKEHAAKLERVAEALEFYADPQTYSPRDPLYPGKTFSRPIAYDTAEKYRGNAEMAGERARAALDGLRGGEAKVKGDGT